MTYHGILAIYVWRTPCSKKCIIKSLRPIPISGSTEKARSRHQFASSEIPGSRNKSTSVGTKLMQARELPTLFNTAETSYLKMIEDLIPLILHLYQGVHKQRNNLATGALPFFKRQQIKKQIAFSIRLWIDKISRQKFESNERKVVNIMPHLGLELLTTAYSKLKAVNKYLKQINSIGKKRWQYVNNKLDELGFTLRWIRSPQEGENNEHHLE